MEEASDFNLALRIPGWCKNAAITVNGKEAAFNIIDGYAILSNNWKNGDSIELKLDITPKFMQANPKVRADAGKAAIQRGPLIYCLEEMDNGSNLNAVSVDISEELLEEFDNDLLGGAVIVKAKGLRIQEEDWGNELYGAFEVKTKEVQLKAVPYFLWGNRTPGEMSVWIRSY